MLTILISIMLAILLQARAVFAQDSEEPPISIDAPLPGEAIQGLTQITGFINLDRWDSFDLEFSFSGQEVWFPITLSGTEIIEGSLGEWDTSSITDGNYDLRLTVFLPATSPMEFRLDGIRVRNYSAIETSTPAPTVEDIQVSPTPTPEESPTPEPKATSTPRPLSPNPAEYATPDLKNALIKGGIFGIILFAFLALIFRRKSS